MNRVIYELKVLIATLLVGAIGFGLLTLGIYAIVQIAKAIATGIGGGL